MMAMSDMAPTFRALGSRLRTGAGALYWHIENKDELLVGATDVVVDRALANVSHHAKPRKAIHAIALNVFETIDAHPWVAAQLVRNPCHPLQGRRGAAASSMRGGN